MQRDDGSTAVLPMAASVAAFFAQQGIPFAPIDGTTLSITRYEGENGQWRCVASVDDVAQTFVFYSLIEVVFDPEMRAGVTEFLMRATAGLVVGNFEFDFETDSISFRTSIDVEGDRLSPALVANVVSANLMVVDHYLPGLTRVAHGSLTPEGAIELVDADDGRIEVPSVTAP
jgi:hypothetical protein